jgi:hypothetical protein
MPLLTSIEGKIECVNPMLLAKLPNHSLCLCRPLDLVSSSGTYSPCLVRLAVSHNMCNSMERSGQEPRSVGAEPDPAPHQISSAKGSSSGKSPTVTSSGRKNPPYLPVVNGQTPPYPVCAEVKGTGSNNKTTFGAARVGRERKILGEGGERGCWQHTCPRTRSSARRPRSRRPFQRARRIAPLPTNPPAAPEPAECGRLEPEDRLALEQWTAGGWMRGGTLPTNITCPRLPPAASQRSPIFIRAAASAWNSSSASAAFAVPPPPATCALPAARASRSFLYVHSGSSACEIESLSFRRVYDNCRGEQRTEEYSSFALEN